MIPSFSGLLPADFSPASRVWIYQGDRMFNEKEEQLTREMIGAFTTSWRSHGAVVRGFGTVLFHRFIILIADETAATVSGCSTDSSVQLIRDISSATGIGLFDRQLLAFQQGESAILIPIKELSAAVREGRLTADSLFFNNAVTTLEEMRRGWIIPAGQSWLKHRPAFAGVAG